MAILNAQDLNSIGKSSGFGGAPFSSVGLPTSPGSRNLNLAAGNPVGQVQQGQEQSQAVGNTTSSSNGAFSEAIKALLQKYQGMQTGAYGGNPFQGPSYDAEKAKADASTAALTDPAMKGYAPSAIMSGAKSAEEPYNQTISGLDKATNIFNTGSERFLTAAKDILTASESSRKEMEAQAKDVVHEAISSGSESVNSLMQSPEGKNIMKLAGYDQNTLQGISTGLAKKESAKKAFSTVDLGDQVGILDEQGNMIKSYAKNKTPGSIFTKTQANKGAVNAGLSQNDFSALEPDVKNYWVNSTSKQAEDTHKMINSVKDGSQDANTVKDLIDSSNASDAVKVHLKGLVDQVTPPPKKGFLQGIENFLGGAYHSLVGQ